MAKLAVFNTTRDINFLSFTIVIKTKGFLSCACHQDGVKEMINVLSCVLCAMN